MSEIRVTIKGTKETSMGTDLKWFDEKQGRSKADRQKSLRGGKISKNIVYLTVIIVFFIIFIFWLEHFSRVEIRRTKREDNLLESLKKVFFEAEKGFRENLANFQQQLQKNLEGEQAPYGAGKRMEQQEVERMKEKILDITK